MKNEDISRIAGLISNEDRGVVRTAGRIEFVRDQGPVRRDLRAHDYEWSADSLRNLTKILWAAQRAHSYSVSALRLFSKMPSSQFSPDGLLGGRGYIQSIRDLRKSLSQASEILSGFTDTLYDEINAKHWDSSYSKESEQLLKNTEEVKQNPEAFVEDEYRTEGERDFLNLDPSKLNPSPSDFGQAESESEVESDSVTPEESGFSQQAASLGLYSKNFQKFLENQKPRLAGGNSSVPVDTLSGPRVNRVGPGEAEYGFFNGPEALPSDDPALSGFITDEPIYEDVAADGVTGYDNPTDGDSIRNASGYSFLPGSDNLKEMPYYTPGLTSEDIEWLVSHAEPENPVKLNIGEKVKNNTNWIWKDV